jgi:hypothetical protein
MGSWLEYLTTRKASASTLSRANEMGAEGCFGKVQGGGGPWSLRQAIRSDLRDDELEHEMRHDTRVLH